MTNDQLPQHPCASGPVLRAVAMPADANPSGDIFGGWLLSQMDLAGGVIASQRARGRVATVAITAMTFRAPVLVGDLVSCYAAIIAVGRSSITVKIESWSQRKHNVPATLVTEGIFTYVAIGPDRHPRPIPPEEPDPPEEQGRKEPVPASSR